MVWNGLQKIRDRLYVTWSEWSPRVDCCATSGHHSLRVRFLHRAQKQPTILYHNTLLPHICKNTCKNLNESEKARETQRRVRKRIHISFRQNQMSKHTNRNKLNADNVEHHMKLSCSDAELVAQWEWARSSKSFQQWFRKLIFSMACMCEWVSEYACFGK